MRSEFENSIKRSASYEKLVYQHGERIFIFDDGKYKIAAVQLAWELEQHNQSRVDELQKRVDAAFRVLSQLNALDDEAHKRWKREACMFSQGESNAYEHAVRLLEQALKGGGDE